MIILSDTGGVAETNTFLVADESAGKAALFDAPDHTVGPLLDEAVARKWELVGLWLTHGHFDHFADHAVVKRRFPHCQVLIHELDEPKARKPEVQTRLFGLPFIIPPLTPDAHVTEGNRLTIGNLEIVVIHTPGHSPGHVVYHFPKEKVLVGGDLIIGGSIGRTDLPDSNQRDMMTSLRRVMALPPETRLLGGHGLETTLGNERQENPFIRMVLGE